MSTGVSAPKVPRLLEAPCGTVTSVPAGRSRRGINVRRCPPHIWGTVGIASRTWQRHSPPRGVAGAIRGRQSQRATRP
eukprot:11172993-Lingulodinium_polyedra.AAC.1